MTANSHLLAFVRRVIRAVKKARVRDIMRATGSVCRRRAAPGDHGRATVAHVCALARRYMNDEISQSETLRALAAVSSKLGCVPRVKASKSPKSATPPKSAPRSALAALAALCPSLPACFY